VIEWLKTTAEDLMRENVPSSKDAEVVDGFTREIGRPSVAFKVISVGEKVDTITRHLQGL
jgi:hypothetical protein